MTGIEITLKNEKLEQVEFRVLHEDHRSPLTAASVAYEVRKLLEKNRENWRHLEIKVL